MHFNIFIIIDTYLFFLTTHTSPTMFHSRRRPALPWYRRRIVLYMAKYIVKYRSMAPTFLRRHSLYSAKPGNVLASIDSSLSRLCAAADLHAASSKITPIVLEPVTILTMPFQRLLMRCREAPLTPVPRTVMYINLYVAIDLYVCMYLLYIHDIYKNL